MLQIMNLVLWRKISKPNSPIKYLIPKQSARVKINSNDSEVYQGKYKGCDIFSYSVDTIYY